MLAARTDSNKVVVFEGDISLVGKMIKVKIVKNPNRIRPNNGIPQISYQYLIFLCFSTIVKFCHQGKARFI